MAQRSPRRFMAMPAILMHAAVVCHCMDGWTDGWMQCMHVSMHIMLVVCKIWDNCQLPAPRERERKRDRATQPPGFNRFGLKFSPLGIAGGIWTQRGHYLKEHIAEQLEPRVNDTVSHAESQTAVKQTAVKRSLDYEMLFHFKTTKLSQIIKK